MFIPKSSKYHDISKQIYICCMHLLCNPQYFYSPLVENPGYNELVT